MTKHKKFEMLVAKGLDMDLVILLKYPSMKDWEVSPNAYPPHKDHVEAFLCRPEHLAACRKGLSGEIVEVEFDEEQWRVVKFDQIWSKDAWYMDKEVRSR
ncbi:hypothetical protein OTK49_02480 [Vibrio coralliirubri]|uniref:hypothetical protein n=1 Tax=Vibrio coralliirubri TaxID=1516159 RepID=UPI002283AF8A|nr:hypothetical protein [Vibrio coralliirubri]MCY9861383.1 hypothetical protein [Vibrio coralliirubri]